MSKSSSKKGISLVEVVIGIAIIVGAVLASFVYFSLAIKVARQSAETIQATLLVEEGIEALRVIRDSGYSSGLGSLSKNQDYFLSFSGSTWQSTTASSTIDGVFTRTFFLEEVRRDSNDDIVLTGGSVDPDTLEVTVVVSWQAEDGDQKVLETSTYLTNAYND